MSDAPPGHLQNPGPERIAPEDNLPLGKLIPEYPPALPPAPTSLCPVASTTITMLDPLQAQGIAEAGTVIHFRG